MKFLIVFALASLAYADPVLYTAPAVASVPAFARLASPYAYAAAYSTPVLAAAPVVEADTTETAAAKTLALEQAKIGAPSSYTPYYKSFVAAAPAVHAIAPAFTPAAFPAPVVRAFAPAAIPAVPALAPAAPVAAVAPTILLSDADALKVNHLSEVAKINQLQKQVVDDRLPTYSRSLPLTVHGIWERLVLDSSTNGVYNLRLIPASGGYLSRVSITSDNSHPLADPDIHIHMLQFTFILVQRVESDAISDFRNLKSCLFEETQNKVGDVEAQIDFSNRFDIRIILALASLAYADPVLYTAPAVASVPAFARLASPYAYAAAYSTPVLAAAPVVEADTTETAAAKTLALEQAKIGAPSSYTPYYKSFVAAAPAVHALAPAFAPAAFPAPVVRAFAPAAIPAVPAFAPAAPVAAVAPTVLLSDADALKVNHLSEVAKVLSHS
ncbi:hypothetical protein J6590_000903 [Homalodisca vitripennis]|nr:hypothetical protein J6590_000903 [Homalodisca vitripennis]